MRVATLESPDLECPMTTPLFFTVGQSQPRRLTRSSATTIHPKAGHHTRVHPSWSSAPELDRQRWPALRGTHPRQVILCHQPRSLTRERNSKTINVCGREAVETNKETPLETMDGTWQSWVLQEECQPPSQVSDSHVFSRHPCGAPLIPSTTTMTRLFLMPRHRTACSAPRVKVCTTIGR